MRFFIAVAVVCVSTFAQPKDLTADFEVPDGLRVSLWA